ncbi:MAG: CotH kinase family protein [Bacteroidales bacterium]|jgi:spore coat protein CotH|nr:CotH kinase family protein [Bacteroidales bacterium]
MKKIYLILGLFFVTLFGLNAQGFYDINTINTIEITFEESNWDAILDQLYEDGDEERLVGSVSINGQVFDSAGIRYKGNSTYSPNQVKNPLNIKLDHIIDQTIDGYGTLKLANLFKDPSFIREALSYEIARNYFPASQANFANVYINGIHLGLYTSDQSVDKFFMRNHFASDENTRVKGEITTNGPPSGGVWEYYGEDSTDYYGYYEMKSDYGWGVLIDFLDTLSNHNEYVDQVLNIDRHLWFLAFSNLLVNLDGPINNPQNHYIYKDVGRFNPIPWDLNESFGVYTNHQTLGNLNTTQLQQFSPFANLNESEFPIISKILTNDTYRKIYVAHMKTMIEENFSNGYYETRALEIQDIIAEDVQADNNKFYSYDNFISNIYNQVGGGPQGGIIGIVQLMDSRTNYLLGLTDFQYDQPEISNVAHSPVDVSPNTEVWFTAEVGNVSNVFLAYRSNSFGVFEKIVMYDDGIHEDGQAGDGVFGVSIIVGSTDLQYYIYAENSDAVAFSPVRAEYEFYEISISGDLVVNEFMADNENAVSDQDGEYDDWIELYNNGSEDINLEGFYLGDDGGDPYQWAFPDTTISGGGYMIVWADDDEDQEGLHANFKLSASGETIVLSDNNMNLLDEVTYLQQKPDTTTGRYPNGTGDFIFMLPSFGEENTNLITSIGEDILASNTGFTLDQNRPNPFHTNTTIDFSIQQDNEVTLNIMNSQGRIIETLVSGNLIAGDYSYSWSAGRFPKGLYFYALSVGGQIQVKKMLIQ